MKNWLSTLAMPKNLPLFQWILKQKKSLEKKRSMLHRMSTESFLVGFPLKVLRMRLQEESESRR